jgi:hypothetical protein
VWIPLAPQRLECVKAPIDAVGWIFQVRFGIQMLESIAEFSRQGWER